MAEIEAGPEGFGRRHYEAIAGVLRGVRPFMGEPDDPAYSAISDARANVWRQACRAFADMLESGNGRFDRAQFLRACGVTNG